MAPLVSKLIITRSFIVATVVIVASFGALVQNELTSFNVGVAFAQDAPLDLSALDDDLPTYDGEEQQSPPDVPANATSGSELNEPSHTAQTGKTFQLVAASGWIGVILLVASIVAVTLIIRLLLTVRRVVFIPLDVKEKLADHIGRGDYEGALNIALHSESFLARVASFGLAEADRGWNAIEKALEDAAAEETAKIYRKTELLATIGNVAPMLGLLGTVLGMVSTFGELAVSDDSGRNLANGIYFALVTTVDGLIVAIPVLVARSLINAKIASLVSETVETLNRVFAPLKREIQAERTSLAPEKTASSSPSATARSRSLNAASNSSARPQTPSGGLREIPKPAEVQPVVPQRESARQTLSLRPEKRESTLPSDPH